MTKDKLQNIKNILFQYKDNIYNFFSPFDKVFDVVIISEDEIYYDQFYRMFQSLITNNEFQKYGLKCQLDSKDNSFKIKIDEQRNLKFRFTSLILVDNERNKIKLVGDIFVPIFCLDKYKPQDYNCLPHEIDSFLGKIRKQRKIAIVALINFDSLLKNPVTEIRQWEKLINNIYENMQNERTLYIEDEEITENGLKILNAVSTILQRHINKNRTSNAYKICNFFYTDKDTDNISFGHNEFTNNLLMSLLSFDKLSNYEYIINKFYKE